MGGKGESQWLVSFDEFKSSFAPQSNATSVSNSLETELRDRRSTAVFIGKLGQVLGLPRVAVATAQVFMHRFYLRCSFKAYSTHEMSCVFLFIAGKLEESPRKLRDILYQCMHLRFKSPELPPGFSEGSPDYQRLYDRVIALERVALVMLCFDLTIDHPYRHAARILRSHQDRFSEAVSKQLWAAITASYETPLCLLFAPKVLALAQLVRALREELPDQDDSTAINALLARLNASSWSEAFPAVELSDVTKALDFLKDESVFLCSQ